MSSMLNYFYLNRPLGFFNFSKQIINSISLTTWTLRIASPWTVCMEATYLLTTVKEVETSVQGQECHLLLKWHCCMWAPLNEGLGLTSQYPLQRLWKRSHPHFVCPHLCPSCDRNILARARATFYCHIPLHCSHTSEPNYIRRFPFSWDVTTSVGDCWPMSRDSVVVSTS